MSNDQILAYVTLLLAVFTATSLVLGVVIYFRQCNAHVFPEPWMRNAPTGTNVERIGNRDRDGYPFYLL
jgi:hypothetical protein